MNVYDKAYELTKALKESSEWQALQAARTKVESDQQSHSIYTSLRSKQIELQQKQLTGEELNPVDIEAWQKQYEIALLHSDIKDLIDSENKLAVILEDIQRIIYEAISN